METAGCVRGILVPHVPTLLEYEMDHKPSQVITGLKSSGKRMKDWGVDAVVVADTHSLDGKQVLHRQLFVSQNGDELSRVSRRGGI